MTNYSYMEKYVLASCLNDTDNYRRLTTDMFSGEFSEATYNLIGKMMKGNPEKSIMRTTLFTYVNGEWSKHMVSEAYITEIYDILQSHIQNNNKVSNKKEYASCVNKLSYRWKTLDVSMQLQEAIELIKEGKVREGLIKAKTVNIGTGLELPDTYELMLESVDANEVIESNLELIDTRVGGWLRGNVYAISGDTGSLKTQVALWIILRALIANPNLKAIFFEKEMHKKEMGRRLMSYFTNILLMDVVTANRNKDTDSIERIKEKIRITAQKEEVKSIISRLSILSTEEFDTAEDIYDYVDSYTPDIICIDFLTMLGDSSGKVYEGEGFMKQQMGLLKHMTTVNNMVTFIISQLRSTGVGNRKIKIANKNDSEWAKQLNQYAAQIYMTFRPHRYESLHGKVPSDYYYLVADKVRHGEDHMHIPLICSPENNRFYQPDKKKEEDMLNWIKAYRGGTI